MEFNQVKTVAIIGAGVAGLSAARSMIALGLDCKIFERNPVLGGVWSDGYLNFGAQVQRELYEFPDWPLPEGTPDFTPGPIIEKYLAEFSDHFGITPHIEFNTKVTNIAEGKSPKTGWIIESTCNNKEKTETFDLVVVCIGLYSNVPNIVEFPDKKIFSGSVIHNSKLKSIEQLKGKRVAVVGFGKSATDAALEAAGVASKTHIIFRTPHWPVPQKLAGILPFKWGMLHRMSSTLIPPYQYKTATEKIIHGLGRPLVWFYWRLVETLLYFQCQLGSRFGSRVGLAPDKPIEIDAFGESTMIPKAAFYKRARKGDINLHKTTVEKYTPTGVKLADGTSIDLDLVILATGWKTDYSFISPDVWKHLEPENDGFYLYRHILHPNTPGLVFIGRASSISSILTYSLQAHWLGELIKGRVSLPEIGEMKANINEMKAWKRAWMPFSAARSARLIVHTQHYHDELLRDFDANPLRKTGAFAPLKELLAPYDAKDYSSLFSG